MQQRQWSQKIKKESECKLPSARRTELQRDRREQTRCAVEYDGTVSRRDQMMTMKCRDGKYWKWPQLEDKVFYHKQNVQKKLNLMHQKLSVHMDTLPLMTLTRL